MHVDEEQLQRLVDDELAEPVDDWAREHMMWCEACRERVARAKSESAELFALLGHLDHPRPQVSAAAVAATARAAESHWIRKAAGFVLAAALAGAAYAAPGSPIPALVDKVLGRDPDQSATVVPAAVPRESPNVSGVTVAPGERLVISFAASQSTGNIRVSLSGGADVTVRAIGEGGSFTTAEELLTIQNAGSRADFDVVIPRAAPWVEIRAGGERVFLKDGSRTVFAQTTSSGQDTYVIPLTRTR